MEKGEDEEGIRWLEYWRFPQDVYTSRPFCNSLRNTATIVQWLKHKTIGFEVHLCGGVGLNWLQHLYSTGSLVVTIDLIVVPTSFTGIIFLTGRHLQWMWAQLLVVILFVTFECYRWVFKATSKRWRWCSLIIITVLHSSVDIKLCLSGHCDLRMWLHQIDDRYCGCKLSDELVYHMVPEVLGLGQLSDLVVILVFCSSKVYSLSSSLLNHLI